MEQMTTAKKRKKWPFIVGGIAAFILILIVVIAVQANKNVKAMNSSLDAALEEIQKVYTLTPVDAGEYEELTIYGMMKFDVEQYKIEELGNLSVMRMNMGLMQMSTLVITPKDKNMPLFSVDYIYMLGNRKAYLEFYDVVEEKDDTYLTLIDALKEVKSRYSDLEDFEASEAWYEDLISIASYKSGKNKDDAKLEQILADSMSVYLKHAKELPELTEEQKAKKLEITIDYTNGLVEQGGVSTDVFKKELGEEETKKFFANVFFGTAAE